MKSIAYSDVRIGNGYIGTRQMIQPYGNTAGSL